MIVQPLKVILFFCLFKEHTLLMLKLKFMFSALPTGVAIALGAGSDAFVVLIELFVYKKRKQPQNDTRDLQNSTPENINSIGHNLPLPTGNQIYFVNGNYKVSNNCCWLFYFLFRQIEMIRF